MRGFVIGLVFFVGLAATVLSLRPGGLRRQLRMAARRMRIALVLGGVYVAGSVIVRIAFPTGPVADYGLPVLALALVAVFVIVAQDPSPTRPGS